MKKLIVLCTLAAIASTMLYASNARAYQDLTRDQSRGVVPDKAQNATGRKSIEILNSADGNRRSYNDAQTRLTALRAQLAKGWEALGMPKEAAEQVAAGYQENGTLTAHRVSVRNKSDAEIATMLQAALADKDYSLANQTLIAFQRKKLKDEGHTFDDDQK